MRRLALLEHFHHMALYFSLFYFLANVSDTPTQAT